MLREIRRQQGHTLRGAASDLGIAASQLSRIERGERQVGDDIAAKLSEYYQVSSEVVDLARGLAPLDVLSILREHPEEIDRLRKKYGR